MGIIDHLVNILISFLPDAIVAVVAIGEGDYMGAVGVEIGEHILK